jgi:multiple sugar transport system ATP-binding protein
VEIDENLGADSLLWLKAEGANMSVRVPVEGRLPAGTKVHLGLDIPKASLFDAKTEQRI